MMCNFQVISSPDRNAVTHVGKKCCQLFHISSLAGLRKSCEHVHRRLMKKHVAHTIESQRVNDLTSLATCRIYY